MKNKFVGKSTDKDKLTAVLDSNHKDTDKLIPLDTQLELNDEHISRLHAENNPPPIHDEDIPPPPLHAEDIPPPPRDIRTIDPVEDADGFINALISHGFDDRKLNIIKAREDMRDQLPDIAKIINEAYATGRNIKTYDVIRSIDKKIDDIHRPLRRRQGGRGKKTRRRPRKRR